MHIMGVLVRIHLVILMIAFTFPALRRAEEANQTESVASAPHLAARPRRLEEEEKKRKETPRAEAD